MDTKIAHTPGPWRAFNVYGQNIYPEWDAGGRYHIAEVCPEGYENDECDIAYCEAKANANLIAAAPDLLAACEFLVSEVDGCELDAAQVEARNRAVAAIANAKGGAS